MRAVATVVFFMLNGQCWVSDGSQAVNLSNVASIENHGDKDIHIYSGYSTAYMSIDLDTFLQQMRQQCVPPQAAGKP